MLPPADFRLAKIVAEIITSKQNVLPWSIAWRSDFDGVETLGEILEFWRNTTFCSVVCCELFFQWLLLERFWHLQGSFQGALGLDNCVRYRCNRPRLYLTEEHSIRWKFCLVNHKLFHLIFLEHHRFDLFFDPFEDQRKLTACHSVQKYTKKLFRKSFGWARER